LESECEGDRHSTNFEKFSNTSVTLFLKHLDTLVSYRVLLHVKSRNGVGEYHIIVVEHFFNSLPPSVGDIFEERFAMSRIVREDQRRYCMFSRDSKQRISRLMETLERCLESRPRTDNDGTECREVRLSECVRSNTSEVGSLRELQIKACQSGEELSREIRCKPTWSFAVLLRKALPVPRVRRILASTSHSSRPCGSAILSPQRFHQSGNLATTRERENNELCETPHNVQNSFGDLSRLEHDLVDALKEVESERGRRVLFLFGSDES